VRINNGVWYELYFSSIVRLTVAANSGSGTPDILRVVGKFSGVMLIAAIANDNLGPGYSSAAAAANGCEAMYDTNSDIYQTCVQPAGERLVSVCIAPWRRRPLFPRPTAK
jgi:hypothetical protein